MSKQKLAERVALITGSSKGLGKAMAMALAAEGARLALVSRNRELLNEAAEQARRLGAEAEVFVADVSDEPQVIQLAKDVIGRFGRLHILINNAGINIRKPVTEFTLQEWNSVIGTNLTSAFLMCRSFLPSMKDGGYGRILSVASMMARVSMPQRVAYSSSKAALVGFTKSLALELAPDGITANTISPGPFATEMNTSLLENAELKQYFTSRIPLGRWGKLEEIGQLAAYLCSEEAGFITGSDILIDGGWSAQ